VFHRLIRRVGLAPAVEAFAQFVQFALIGFCPILAVERTGFLDDVVGFLWMCAEARRDARLSGVENAIFPVAYYPSFRGHSVPPSSGVLAVGRMRPRRMPSSGPIIPRHPGVSQGLSRASRGRQRVLRNGRMRRASDHNVGVSPATVQEYRARFPGETLPPKRRRCAFRRGLANGFSRGQGYGVSIGSARGTPSALHSSLRISKKCNAFGACEIRLMYQSWPS